MVLKSGEPLPKKQQISKDFQTRSEAFLTLWGISELAGYLDIQFSNRLRSSLGRTRVDMHRVRLNPLLINNDESLLDEVLCHELAHIAVYERFGTTVKPHGPEWADLVRMAGYEPRLRIEVFNVTSRVSGKRFEHLCPVCQALRYAKRPMTRWRCKRCVTSGLEGKLLIRSIGKE